MRLVTLSLHNVVKVVVTKKEFNNFKLIQYGFEDFDGSVTWVNAFCENNEYPVVEEQYIDETVPVPEPITSVVY